MGYAAGNHSSHRPDYGYHSGYNSGGTPRPPRPPRPSGGSGNSKKGKTSILAVIAVIILVLLIIAIGGAFSSGGVPSSTVNREKLSGVGSYNSDCVVDSLGWLNDASKAGRDLKSFYEATGVQPYVVFNEYDSSLTSDDKMDEFAEQWYKDNINDENTFVFMYFGTDHEGEGEPGYMCYVMGNRVDSVMDSEAIDIFWAYIDKNWYDNSLSENQVIVNSFNETAERIMTKSRTMADVLIWLIIAVIVIGGLLLVLRIRKQKRQHEAEKAKETEQILNTPLETTADELLEQYSKPDSANKKE